MWVGSTTMLTAVREPMTAARIMEDGALRVAERRRRLLGLQANTFPS